MSDAYERQRIVHMVWNFVKHMSFNHQLSLRFLGWVEDNSQVLRTPPRLQALLDSKEDIAPRQLWDETKALIQRRATAKSSARPGILETHIQRVGALFGLDRLEMEILGLVVSYRNEDSVESFIDAVSDFKPCGPGLVASFLGVKQNELQRRLQKYSRLVATGLLDVEFGCRRFEDVLTVSDSLMKALAPPRKNQGALREALLGVPGKTDLLWEDFEHVSAQRDLLAKLLAGAVEGGEPGVNVLVYGPPGTGKTEFCKVVACKLGMDLYSVGETDDSGDEPLRRERLQSLRMNLMLLANQDSALVLFDEMEDVFANGPRSDMLSRVFVHRLLETNIKPILWTCNHIDSFDPAILRRMSMVIEIKTPCPRVRERVWARVLARQQLELPADAVRILSREFEAPPALAANAARAARLAGGDWEDVRMLVQGVNKILTGRNTPPCPGSETLFDPDLAHATINLSELTDRLANAGASRFSLCLAGPPGTGKSAYARHLAEKLGMTVLQKRASDLISKWVGDSEKAIAEAFAQAREEGAMLIFDEADSLLSDRRGAKQTWEVSQVNEMLTWMENHPLPFVCTTNLMERLDQASLRRFLFKVDFGYLPEDKVCKAFALFFGVEPPAASLHGLDRLTPGDFSLVARKAAVMGKAGDTVELARMLMQEQQAKPGAKAAAIGFWTQPKQEAPRKNLP